MKPDGQTQTPLQVLLAHLPLARRTRIVDVGANPNIGDPPYLALLNVGACDVVGFEPQPIAFAALAERKSDRETYFPFAVGDGSRKTMNVYRSQGYTSVYEPYAPGFRVVGGKSWAQIDERIDFDTVALDDQPQIGVFDLLKIDIQGGECDVFRGGEASMKPAMAVIVELRYFQLYDGEPMMGGVDRELRRQGFSLHKLMFNQAKPLRNSQMHRLNNRMVRDQLIDGDAVYVRDLGMISSYSDAQLMHLSVLAASVFTSHTLVLHCLDDLVRREAAPPNLPGIYVDAMPADLLRDKLAAE